VCFGVENSSWYWWTDEPQNTTEFSDSVLVSEVNRTNYYTDLIRGFYDDFEYVSVTYIRNAR